MKKKIRKKRRHRCSSCNRLCDCSLSMMECEHCDPHRDDDWDADDCYGKYYDDEFDFAGYADEDYEL